jgi:uncharacterized membrane protein YphA (DoxX/SURF4 family)
MPANHHMPRSRTVYILFYGCRMILGIVFIWASWDKLLAPADFARIIHNYQILPATLVYPAALILPWVEIVCGVFLVIGRFTKGAVLVVNLMLVIFISAYLSTLVRGLDVDCGCFTVSLQAAKRSYFMIFRDLLFLGAGIAVFIYEIRSLNRDAQHVRG